MSEAAPALAVLSPLRGELEPGLRGLALEPLPGLSAPAALFRVTMGDGRAALVGWSGMGRAATERALAVLAAARPLALLHLGVAGALRADLSAGAAIVCARALRHVEGAGEVEAVEAVEAPGGAQPEALLARLTAAGALERGAAVTVEALAGAPARKRALAARHPQGVVVEMETYWVLREAARLGLPVVCARVVVDGLDQALPDLSAALDPVGRPRPLRLAAQLVRRPRTALALPALGAAFGRAQRVLAGLTRAALVTPRR